MHQGKVDEMGAGNRRKDRESATRVHEGWGGGDREKEREKETRDRNTDRHLRKYTSDSAYHFIPERVEAVEVLAEPVKRQLPPLPAELAPNPRPFPREARGFLQEASGLVVEHKVTRPQPIEQPTMLESLCCENLKNK